MGWWWWHLGKLYKFGLDLGFHYIQAREDSNSCWLCAVHTQVVKSKLVREEVQFEPEPGVGD